MPELPSGTVTFLFTDIEGSTRLLKQLRAAYGDVLAEHQRLVRAAFEGAGGREIDTQGDAFFFAFPTAKDAVTAALIGQRSLAGHDWPEGIEVKVRMGLHTGEPALGEERYVGLGVHRAARICAAAHGGQVLLSDATRAVSEDELSDGVALRDLGEHSLKDIDRPERLYQLVAPDLPADFPPLRTGREETAFAGREGELAEAAEAAVARPRRRRRALLLAVLAGLLAAAVAVPILTLRAGDGSADPVAVEPNSVAVIDPGSNEVVGAVAVGTGPSQVAVGEGAVWVLNGGDLTVSRINPATMESRTIATGTTPTDLAVGGGAVWLVTHCPETIFRLDPGSNIFERVFRVRSECPPGGPYTTFIAYGYGAIWVVNEGDDIVWRIDPVANVLEAEIPVPAPGGAGGIAVGEGAVWVKRSGAVVRVAAETGSTATIDVQFSSQGAGAVGGGIAAGEGGVWPTDGDAGILWRIDPDLGGAQRTITVGSRPLGVGVGDDSVWVANSSDGTVSRVDPTMNEVVNAIEVGNTPRDVAVGEGLVWVTVT